MGKLFDIVGYKVVIHNDALGIPCFKKLWDSSKDKSFATNAISYIVLKNHPNSPYVGSMEESKRDSILRRELFDDKWVPNEDVLYAEKMYLEFNDTLSLKMLRSFRKKLESITTFLDEPTEHMDMKMVKEILSSAITKEMFKATGWFEKRLTKAEKKAIKQAEKVSELDNLRKSAEKLTLIESRINTKRDEYREKYVSLLKKVDNEFLAGETLQNMEEAITVYHNLIDLLNKLTA